MKKTIDKLIKNKPFHIDFKMVDGILEFRQIDAKHYIELGSLSQINNIEICEDCVKVTYAEFEIKIDEMNVY